MRIVIDNRIRIPLQGLSDHAIEKLKKCVEHDNPEFMKRRSMGYATWSIPAKIRSWKVEDGALTIPRGAMARVRNILNKEAITFKLTDKRISGPAPDFILEYVGFPPRDYQEEASNTAVQKHQGVIRASTGCLSGDTIVELNRAGKSFQCELRRLVKMLSGGLTRGHTWDPKIETSIRMRDAEGYIRLGTVLDAYSSGIKRTYAVTTKSGKTVRATLDHRFLTADGWKRLKKIQVGDRVYVDAGAPKLFKKKGRKSFYKSVKGMQHHPFSGRAAVGRKYPDERSCWEHRLVVEASLSGLSYAEFVERVRSGGNLDGLVFLDPKTHHVHHIDENTRNNTLSNLVVMNPLEHAVEHGRDGGWKHITPRTRLDEIVSIGEPRDEETFDIEIVEDEHNFLADGFVVHNSGKTECALILAAKLGVNTLVILPNAKLLEQWQKRAAKAFGLAPKDIGIIRGPKRNLRPLTLATQQTLWKRKIDTELKEFFGAIVIDEMHHTAARTPQETVDEFPARYRIGFTADERRKDRKEFLIYDVCGPVIHETTREQCEALKTVVDVEIRVVPTQFTAAWYRLDHDFHKLLEAMTVDEYRNAIITDIVSKEVGRGEQAIVLTHRREHARTIDRSLIAKGIRSGCMLGGENADDEREFEGTSAGLQSGAVRVGVGTYEALGEGIDLPSVAVGVASTPIATNKQRFNQVRGRLCRPSSGKEIGRLYVLFDGHVFDTRVMRNILAWNKTVTILRGGKWVDARDVIK